MRLHTPHVRALSVFLSSVGHSCSSDVAQYFGKAQPLDSERCFINGCLSVNIPVFNSSSMFAKVVVENSNPDSKHHSSQVIVVSNSSSNSNSLSRNNCSKDSSRHSSHDIVHSCSNDSRIAGIIPTAIGKIPTVIPVNEL